AMNTGRAPLREIEDWAAQDILLLRPQHEVAAILLAPGEAEFLRHLQAGAALEQAATAALTEAGDFDLGAALAAMFTRGTVIAVTD
ncbi:MAG: hypothetical protein ACK4Z4_11045, partial [Ferrovibrio sp.]